MKIDLKENLKNTRSFVVPIDFLTIKDKNACIVKGQEVKMTHQAFKDLLDLVGMTQKSVNHFNQTLKKKAGYSLIRELMKAISRRKGAKIKLYIDELTKKIVRITEDSGNAGGAVPADAIQKLLEFAGRVSGGKVQLADTFISDGGTKVTMNLRWDTEVPITIPGEEISLGKQITWDLLGPTTIADFVERLICTNGMTGIAPSNHMQTLDSSSTTSEWYDLLFKEIVNPNEDFIKKYEHLLLDAKQASLSVREYEMVANHLMRHWEKDAAKIIEYLGPDDWMKDYEKLGQPIDQLKDKQKPNCPTPVNAWDAINALTDLASHRYQARVVDQTRKNTQKMAGKLLTSDWDEDSQIHNVPKY